MTQNGRRKVHIDPRLNRILAQLSSDDYEALRADARIVHMKAGNRICSAGDPVDGVLFPLTCVISVLNGPAPDTAVEVATVGNEGVTGASELLHRQGAMGIHIVQLPGFALKIGPDPFRRHLAAGQALRNLVHSHAYALMLQTFNMSACNRLHSMEERCARWLLITHDRAGAETFPVTQEFLSNMLGVRRATVNAAVGRLKKSGCIRFVRGSLTVADRAGLESASCGCHSTVWQVYDDLLSQEQIA